MLTLEEIVKRLKDKNLKKVAYFSDLSYGTIRSISKGGKNCKYDSIVKISRYLEDE